jgi:hypothetical protein
VPRAARHHGATEAVAQMSSAASLSPAQSARQGRGSSVAPGIGANGVVLLARCGDDGCADEQMLAEVLHARGLATWCIELPADGLDGIEALAERIGHVCGAALRPPVAQHGLGLFGTDVGALAALRVASRWPGCIGAVVAQDGDLRDAADGGAAWLPRVAAPTLLVVVGSDQRLAECNRRALRQLGCNKRLEVVPGAFGAQAGPGARASVAELAAAWFVRHLAHAP